MVKTTATRTKVELPKFDDGNDLVRLLIRGDANADEIANRCNVHGGLAALAFAHVLVRELAGNESMVIRSALEDAGYLDAKAEGRAEASEVEAT